MPTPGGAIDGTGSDHAAGRWDDSADGRQPLHRRHHDLGRARCSWARRDDGSIVGDVSNNGALVFNRSDAYLRRTRRRQRHAHAGGAGVTVLTADHAYTGGTTISAGTLRLGDGGASGSVRGNILNNAALTIDRGDLVSMTNLISGSGRFTQAGSGQTVLSANNAYTGMTEVLRDRSISTATRGAATGKSCGRRPR